MTCWEWLAFALALDAVTLARSQTDAVLHEPKRWAAWGSD